PVVRRADQDCVDVLASKQVAEVVVGIAALVLAGLALLGVVLVDQAAGRLAAGHSPIPIAGPLLVDIADGYHPDPGVAEKAAQVVEPLVACANDAQGDALARGRLVGRTEAGGGNDQGDGQGSDRGGGPAKELSACRLQ